MNYLSIYLIVFCVGLFIAILDVYLDKDMQAELRQDHFIWSAVSVLIMGALWPVTIVLTTPHIIRSLRK